MRTFRRPVRESRCKRRQCPRWRQRRPLRENEFSRAARRGRGLRLRQVFEDRGGGVAHLGCELRLLQDFEDRAERAMLLLVFGVDLEVGGGHAVLPDFFGAEFPAGDLQAAQFGAEEFHAAAGVHQGAKRHVTANTRKTIKISEFHGMPPCGWERRLKGLSAGCRLILSAEAGCVKRAGLRGRREHRAEKTSSNFWAN